MCSYCIGARLGRESGMTYSTKSVRLQCSYLERCSGHMVSASHACHASRKLEFTCGDVGREVMSQCMLVGLGTLWQNHTWFLLLLMGWSTTAAVWLLQFWPRHGARAISSQTDDG